MPQPTDPEAPAVDRHTVPAAPSWAPGEGPDSDVDSRPRVSLGPLSLLGFGDRRQVDRRGGPSPLLMNFVGAAALIIVIAALREAKPVLLPLVVSAFGATLTAPIVFWLTKRKVPAAVAVPVVVFAALVAVTLVAGLVIGSLNAFIQEAPTYRKELDQLIRQVSVYL